MPDGGCFPCCIPYFPRMLAPLMRTWHGADQLVELEADACAKERASATAPFILRATANGHAMLSPRLRPPGSAGAPLLLASLGRPQTSPSRTPRPSTGASSGLQTSSQVSDDASRPSISHALPSLLLGAMLPIRQQCDVQVKGVSVVLEEGAF